MLSAASRWFSLDRWRVFFGTQGAYRRDRLPVTPHPTTGIRHELLYSF